MTLFFYRLALFAVATLAFVTLLNDGAQDFLPNMGREFADFLRWAQTMRP